MNQIHRQNTETARIRACSDDDMPAVAALFQKNFRRHRGKAPASLRAYLAALFLQHPHKDPELASKVFVDTDERILGFIGVMPRHLSLRGRAVRAAIAGSLMVDDPVGNPLAGARLLRAFLTGPQDVSLSETANPVSQAMWQRLGGRIAVHHSLEWMRVLHPAGCGIALAAEKASAARFLAPLASGIDGIWRRLAADRPLPRHGSGGVRGSDADDSGLAEAVASLSAGHTLAPHWQEGELGWLLGHAAVKLRHGSRFGRVVRGRDGRLVGAYVYYGRPGGIAWTLQVLARPGAHAAVVDDLLDHASGQGCVAVRGKIAPGLTEALLTRKCLYFHRSATVYHTGDAEIAAAIAGGEALITGLAGESWSRLIGHDFARAGGFPGETPR